MHHHFGQRHGYRRAGAASFGAAAGRRAELRDPGRIPAEGTRGRALQDGAKTLSLFGQAVSVRAEIVEMGQFRRMRKGRVAALVGWITGRAEANL